MDFTPNIQVREIRIPSAQVKTIVATDFTVVEAPGAGKAILPIWATVTLDFKTAAYVCPNTDHAMTVAGMAFDNDTELQALLEASSRSTVALRPAAGSTPLTENAAAVVAASGTGECTTGDSDLIVRLAYMVIDTAAAE